jgi:hypothetical protein
VFSHALKNGDTLLRSESAEPTFNRSPREATGRRASRPPSAVGYMVVSGCVAALLFFIVWGLLHGTSDEAPWAAALAACVTLLIAASARELFMRRAWSRQVQGFEGRARPDSFGGRVSSAGASRSSNSGARSNWSHSAALRAVQRCSAEADLTDTHESHQEAYKLCREYLETTEEALRAPNLLAEKRVAMRAGLERVRALRRYHLRAWARAKTAAIMNDAKQRTRLWDKLDTAQQALQVVAAALEECPDDAELMNSERGVREFMASSRIAHWVEIAERTAFRGQHRRAIARYQDALFYVSREPMDDDTREALGARIQREIYALRAKIDNVHAFDIEETTPPQAATSKRRARGKQ